MRRSLGAADVVSVPVDRFSRFPDLDEQTIVVVDVDLRSASHVRAVRAGMKRSFALRTVFVVERGSRAEETQASALGAGKLVPRPVDAAALETAIRELLPKVETATGVDPAAIQSVPAAISEGTRVANAVFDCFRAHRPPSPDAVESWSASVDDELDAVGLDRWLSTVRNHHGGAMQHTLMVAGIASRFGASLGLPPAERRILTSAALLHDIGAAKIPPILFEKLGRLTDAEFAVVRKHPQVGADFLADAGLDPRLVAAVRHHHEFLDGSGYPDGLSGSAIPGVVRILTICEIFAGMVEQRSYKLPATADVAFRHLEQLAADGRLDGQLVRAFRRTATEVTTNHVNVSMSRPSIGIAGFAHT